MEIATARLRLIPYSPQSLLALIDGYDAFAACFGLPAAAGLREFFVSDEVSPDWLAALRAAQASDPWVHGFAVIHQDAAVVIGNVGFKGPPNDGLVEIAYGIVPAFQRQGFATEAAQAGAAFAMADDRVCVVRAHTLAEPNASTRMLSKCGFRFIGGVIDLDDGPVWRWEREKEAS